LKAIPILVMSPAVGVSQALSHTLLGLRNAVDRRTKNEEEDAFNLDRDLSGGI